MDKPQAFPGLVQWFAYGDKESVERAVIALRDLRVTELRTLFSWADWTRDDGPEWFDWFIGKLGEVEGLKLLPSLFYTPPDMARPDGEGKRLTSYPPQDLSAYADFAEEMIARYGKRFDWIQIWNEPNWKPYWDWNMDESGDLFAQMATQAAKTARSLGKKTVLGGTTPLDYAWFCSMEERGLLAHCDAVSFHFSPSWDVQHRRWFPLKTEIGALRAMLRGFGRSCEIWIDETGFSTARSDGSSDRLDEGQIDFFELVRAVPADRTYWFCIFDQADGSLTDDTLNVGTKPDPVAFKFGMIRRDGTEKPLYRHWKTTVRK